MPERSIPKVPLEEWQDGVVAALIREREARKAREHRLTRALIIGTTILALMFGALAAVLITFQGRQSGANDALCTLRADMEKRIRLTEDFIRTHPHGFGGIPVGTLKVSAENQKRTVASLSDLSCD